MAASKNDMIKFILLNIFFVAVMIVLIIYKIKSVFAWASFIGIWTYAEARLAQKVHLSNWTWALIIGFLFLLDALILYLFR